MADLHLKEKLELLSDNRHILWWDFQILYQFVNQMSID